MAFHHSLEKKKRKKSATRRKFQIYQFSVGVQRGLIMKRISSVFSAPEFC